MMPSGVNLDSGLSPRGRGKRPPIFYVHAQSGSIPAWAGETILNCAYPSPMSVYPRVGGGNCLCPPLFTCSRGLSPRGRGKPARHHFLHHFKRSIPAWAGETVSPTSAAASMRVYPRVGGGNRRYRCRAGHMQGLSPRGRGKPTKAVAIPEAVRSIPAWAGETLHAGGKDRSSRVYPRVGGGNRKAKASAGGIAGLSPRGRGKRAQNSRRTWRPRSIPAWAGETYSSSTACRDKSVYPRVGGGNRYADCVVSPVSGLSPRGRGKPTNASVGGKGIRSIPAWAGETRRMQTPSGIGTVYPRVGGGNDWACIQSRHRRGLSPRGRGKRELDIVMAAYRRSIPAWAGETAAK